MERDNYLDGIRSAWLGERLGEVFFTTLAERSADPAMRSTWQTLARLEHVTGKRMAALLQAHDEATGVDGPVDIGDEVVERYTSVSHHDAMLRMKDVVETAITRFDQLLAVAPDADVPSVQFLVQHEQALLAFVDRELAGDHAGALQDVDRLLEQAD